MALHDLMLQIQALSSNDADLDSLGTALRHPQTDAVLRQHAGTILDTVQALDADSHSLGCVYLLELKGRALGGPQGDPQFVDAAAAFLLACSPAQVRRAPARFAALCRHLKAHVVAANQPKRGILPLRAAVAKLCPTPDLLSPIHADLFQLCLLAKCYSAASPVIDAHATSVDPSKTACTATDVQLYCYYGGMVEAGRRRYARALDLLLAGITAPTLVVNAITVAALKKYVLVSLLHAGEAPPLPKHAAPAVHRALKAEAGAYLDLAKLVKAGSEEEAAALVVAKAEVWRGDGNAGLAAAVARAAGRRRVAALTRTFLTLPLAEVAAAAGLGDDAAAAEDAVVGMVGAGEVGARVSQRDGMVRFEEGAGGGGGLSAGEAGARVHDLIRQAMALAKEVAAVDHAVSCDRAFISKAAVRGVGGGGGGGGPRLDPGDVPMADAEREAAALGKAS